MLKKTLLISGSRFALALCAGFALTGVDAASAQIFGEAKALLEKQGQRLADADLFIGAIAAAKQATVVTGNRKHYARIPGVTIEDWIRG